VVVTDWSPVTCWLYDDCLLRFCSEPYSLEELHNRYRHITNRTVQQQRLLGSSDAHSSMGGGGGAGRGSRPPSARPSSAMSAHGRSAAARPASASATVSSGPKVSAGASATAEGERNPLAGALWDAAQFAEQLRRCGLGDAWSDDIFPSMIRLVAAVMRSGVERSEVSRRDAFEIFGLDLVLDETLRPWLIEVNESPNLSSHGSKLKERILGPMIASALELVTEPVHMRSPPEAHGGWRQCVVAADAGAATAGPGGTHTAGCEPGSKFVGSIVGSHIPLNANAGAGKQSTSVQ
jgi:hypothetical protein